VLGLADDAKRYAELRDAVKHAFVRAYLKDDGTVLGDTQCGYVLALAAELLDGEAKTRALGKLVKNIDARKGHLSTGVVGTKDLLPVLSRAGRDDVAWRLVENVDYPSWGFTIQQGATTIWERWNGWTREGLRAEHEQPHYAFGAVYD
jgi:alpha-L-rhamnosidase